ncbi:hypothetical protein NDS46_14980 [Paenibacillus thiaminolyticus]|uniref:hypothetical protein n=1 Tax=Paenibacillus thiaminolyticus TaxID=49283 RepID=UPI00232E333D|nr:hypothetical protein [Paenibacillus thiaminolyticus]WCF05700.1 hypothetical protein NDS46_14980 [Paenibacillus thiaminolyticus]
MNSYISIIEDKFVIDPTAKNVVEPKIYEHFKAGVDKLNNAIHEGFIIVEKGQKRGNANEFTTNAFSNTYWWGGAITFDDAETKVHALAMRQSGNTAGLLAAIAQFIPGGWLAAVSGYFWAWAGNSIANDFDYHNRGNGVTLNVHWLPVIYYEVTTNQ